MGYRTGALSYQRGDGILDWCIVLQRGDGIQDWSIVLPEV